MEKEKEYVKQERPEGYELNCCGCPEQEQGGCLTCEIASELDKKMAEKIVKNAKTVKE